MNGYIQRLPGNRGFFWGYTLFLIAGVFMLSGLTQKELFFWVNNRNAALADAAMPWVTDAGDGVFLAALGLFLLLFYNIRAGLAVWTAGILEGLTVQFLKQVVFTDRPRPWAKFGAGAHIHLVPDFTPYTNNSFPSGHTATAFCMAALLAFLWKGWKQGAIFFLLACCIAYSRIYLSQHYFIDVYFGSIVGVLFATVSYMIYFRKDGLGRLDRAALFRLLK